MELKPRIGIDLGRKARLEDGIAWAKSHAVRFLDCEIDNAPNDLASFLSGPRAGTVRAACESAGIRLGLHTLSAVNVAETSPFLAPAVEEYLNAYIDAAVRLGAGWIVVHGGLHFTGDYQSRRTASLERLQRIAAVAEKKKVLLLLENLNKEPAEAEVHYLCHSLEECQFYFSNLASPAIGWAFTANHAHFEPEGVDGFIDAMGMARCGEIRLADNRGAREEHLQPGAGTMDFRRLFQRVEAAGYRGHYMNAFGSLADMLRGRDYLADIAKGG
jgi:sugar phosphate isomerase/epimerase